MNFSTALAQSIFAFLYFTGMDRSHPDAEKARRLAFEMWREAGHEVNPFFAPAIVDDATASILTSVEDIR